MSSCNSDLHHTIHRGVLKPVAHPTTAPRCNAGEGASRTAVRQHLCVTISRFWATWIWLRRRCSCGFRGALLRQQALLAIRLGTLPAARPRHAVRATCEFSCSATPGGRAAPRVETKIVAESSPLKQTHDNDISMQPNLCPPSPLPTSTHPTTLHRHYTTLLTLHTLHNFAAHDEASLRRRAPFVGPRAVRHGTAAVVPAHAVPPQARRPHSVVLPRVRT